MSGHGSAQQLKGRREALFRGRDSPALRSQLLYSWLYLYV